MPEYNAGDARLRIVPDASNFKKDLEAKLRAIQVDYTVRVNVALAQAKRDVDRFMAQQEGRSIGVRVNAQLSNARTDMAAFRAEQRAIGINVPVRANTNEASTALRNLARQSSQTGNSFSSWTRQANQGIDLVTNSVNNMVTALARSSMAAGITALVASIPAAVTGVAALTSAITQLSGAALVVPGAIATAVTSIGTLAVGLSGVVDAYTAVTAAADESSTGQAERARAAASATQGLRNAVVDEAQAQKDVADARRDARQQLQDLNLELRGGQISEAQAINDLAKARRDLARGGFKDQLEYNDALLRVAAAEQRTSEVHQRNLDVQQKKADADAKGIEGSDLVVAANERAVRSHQAVAAAQQAVTDAAGTSTGAVDKAAAAMAKQSQNAQDFINTLVELRPRWDDLRKTVSGNLFEGASTSFTQFVDNVLPNLKDGMGSIATAWNSNIKTLLSSLGSNNSKGLLDRVLGNTADAQNRFNAAIDPLVRGIGTLTAAGSDAIPRLADAIGAVAERFANFIETADKDGRLDEWIDKGLDGFTQLGNILLNIGQMFTGVTKAAGGQGLLKTIEDLTERTANWINSFKGQSTLMSFFAEGRAEIEKLKPIVSNLIDTLPAIWAGAKDALDTVLPFLQTFTDILKEQPDLVRGVVSAFAIWRTISPIIDGVRGSFTLLNTVLGASGAASAAAGAAGGAGGAGGLAAAAAGGGTIAAFAALALLAAGGTYLGVMTGQNYLDRLAGGVPPGYHRDKPGGPLISDFPVNNGDDGTVADLLGDTPPPTGPAPKKNEDLKSAVDQWETDNNVAHGAQLTPDQQASLNAYLHDQGVQGFAAGGPTKAGLAVLHDGEFVLSNRASKYPASFKHALNEGRIDPKALPHFDRGGEYRTDKPPGVGPEPIAPAPTGGDAGGLFGAINDAVAGAQGPINNAIGLFQPGGALGGQTGGVSPIGVAPPGTFSPIAPLGVPPPINGVPSWSPLPASVPGPRPATVASAGNPFPPGVAGPLPKANPTPAPSPAPTPTPTPTPAVPDSAHLPTGAPALPGPDPAQAPGAGANAPAAPPGVGLPGLGGFGQGLPLRQVWQNPDGSPMGLDQILTNLPEKLQPQTIAWKFGQTLLGGVLGFFGLDQSFLSPSNPWNQAAQQTLGFFANQQPGQGSPYGADFSGIPGIDGIVPGLAGATGGAGAGSGAPPGFSLNPGSKIPGRFGASPPTITGALAASLGNPTLYPTSGPDAYKVPEWATKLADQFGLRASTYADGDTLHQAGYAFDFFPKNPGDPQAAANMDALSTYLTTNLQGQTLQLIHRDVTSGQEWRVAGGQPVGPGTAAPGYFNANIGGHGDHVHWATDIAPIYTDPNAAASQQLADAGVPSSAANAILYPFSVGIGNGSQAGAVVGGAPGDLKSRAYQAYLAAGMPPNEWSDFDALITKESGWKPTAKNPGSTAYGLGQFLDTTWASVGGSKTADPMLQLQYIFAYLKSRPDYHGSPSAAWSLWNSRSPHWYDQGGLLPPGLTLAMNKTGQPERILNPAQNRQYEAMLPHFANGGPVALAALPTPPVVPVKPNFSTPDVKPVQPRVPVAPRPQPVAPRPVAPISPAPPSPAPPGPPPGGGPAPVAPTGPNPSTAGVAPVPATVTTAPTGPTGPTGEAPTDYDHNLDAINTGIDSAASAIGQAASTAIGLAAGAAGGVAPGAGAAGAIGPYVAGLIQQGGKVVKDVVNIGSSFLVGNVTPGTTPNAYGEQYRPEQNAPQTTPVDSGRTYVFNGMDSRNIVDDLRTKDAQDNQARLARFGG